jgi:hypothetical protein
MKKFHPVTYSNSVRTTATADFVDVAVWHDYFKEQLYDTYTWDLFAGLAINSGLELAQRDDATSEDLHKAYTLICYGLGFNDLCDSKIIENTKPRVKQVIRQKLKSFII